MELAELSVGTSPGEGRKRGTVGLMLWPAKNKELIITGKQHLMMASILQAAPFIFMFL